MAEVQGLDRESFENLPDGDQISCAAYLALRVFC